MGDEEAVNAFRSMHDNTNCCQTVLRSDTPNMRGLETGSFAADIDGDNGEESQRRAPTVVTPII